MASGRKQVDYTDIRYDAITVKIDNSTITYDVTKANGSAQVGLAVTWSADDTVALTNVGTYVLGKLIKVEADLFATVQNKGMATLGKGDTAIALTRGSKIVGDTLSSARGYIRSSNTATVAELGVQRGEVVNVADTTAAVVDLG